MPTLEQIRSGALSAVGSKATGNNITSIQQGAVNALNRASSTQPTQIPQVAQPVSTPTVSTPNIFQRISNALNPSIYGSPTQRFWSGIGGQALVEAQKPVTAIQKQLSPEVPGSLSQKFWLGQGGDFLAKTQTVMENYKPIKVVDISSKINNPTAKFVVSIPEGMANEGYNFATGRNMITHGVQIGKDINTGAILDPKVYFSDMAGVANDVLDAFIVGGILESAAKTVTGAVAKTFGKPTLTQIAEVTTRNPGFWKVVTRGAIVSTEYGLGFGLVGGLQAGRNIQNNKDYFTNLAVTTVANGIIGGVIGTTLTAGQYGINAAVNHLFVSRVGTFTLKGTPEEVEANVKTGGYKDKQLGQDMLTAARIARENGTDVGFQAYGLKQSPGGKIIGEDKVAGLFGITNQAFNMGALEGKGGITNFKPMPGTTNQNGMVYRFVEIPKDATNFSTDVAPIKEITAPVTPVVPTTAIQPVTPPVTPIVTPPVTPVVPTTAIAAVTKAISKLPIELQPLAQEAIKYKSAGEFIKILDEEGERVVTGNEKLSLILDKPTILSDIESNPSQLTDLGISIPTSKVGGIDVIKLDTNLTSYLKDNPEILTNFYNQAKGISAIPTPKLPPTGIVEPPKITEAIKTAVLEPKTYYRGGAEPSVFDRMGTALEVVNYEIKELGNRDIKVEPGISLTAIPASRLVWVTETPKEAKQYGKVSKVELGKHRIIARDGFGGLLIEKLPEEVAGKPVQLKGEEVISKYIYDKTGKTLEKATKREILDALAANPDESIFYSPEIAKKFGRSLPSDIGTLETRPVFLYGGTNEGVFTDGFFLVLNKPFADKINTGLMESEKNKITKSLVKNTGVAFSEAEKMANADIKRSIEDAKGKYPKYQQLIPTNIGSFDNLTTLALGGGYIPTLILRGSKGEIVGINPDYYQYLQNNLPGTHPQLSKIEDVKSPVVFMEGDKIQAMVMPLDIGALADKYKITPAVKVPVQEPIPTKKVTIGAKKLPVKEEFKVGDIFDTQGHTNMVGTVTIREISGNTLKFTDSKGTDFAGMQRSTVRDLIKGGSWKKVSHEVAPKPTETKVTIGVKKPKKIISVIVGRNKILRANPEYEAIVTKAKELGAVAFEKGIKAPSQDPEMMKLLEGVKTGHAVPILMAWNEAFTKANLKPGSTFGKKITTPSGTGDVGGYAENNREAQLKEMFGESYDKIRPIEMPEITQLARELLGKTPTVKNFRMNALGYFKVGDIVLRPSIFKDPFLARRVLAHEIGHATDWLPDYTLARGNELGRIGTLRDFLRGSFSDPETEKKIDDLTKELKDLQEKRRTLKEPVLDEQGKQVIENQKPKYIISDTGADKSLLARIKELNKEVDKLQENSIKDKEIRKELKDWTQYWKPFDESKVSDHYQQYRYSSVELYADAISGLFNDPETLKIKAPKFWDAYFKFLDRKPQVEKAFSDLQTLINAKGDTLYKRRDEFLDKAYKDAEAKFVAKELEHQQRKTSVWMDIRTLFDSKNAKIISQVRESIKQGAIVSDQKNPEILLEDLQYIDSYIKNKIEDLYQPVKDKTSEVEDGWNKLGKILQLERAINERGEMANPGGYDPKTAQEQLDYMQRTIPAKDWDKLQSAKDDFRKATQSLVTEAEKAGFYRPEMIQEMKANPAYATFQVIDYLDTYVSPSVHRQLGTLKDIANPATSSVIKAISLLRAIERNNAKLTTIDYIKENHSDEIIEAPTHWNGRTQVVTERKMPGMDLVMVRDQGKLKGYYIDPYIARGLNNMSDPAIRAMSGIMRVISGASFYRPLFTSVNLGFQTYNITKDFLRYWKNLPDETLGQAIKSFPKTLGFYKKAVKPSWDRAMNQRNDLIKEMEDMKVLGLTYNNIAKNFDPEDAQIERTLQKIGLGKPKDTSPAWKKPFIKLWDTLEIFGNFIETLPKVAGYQQLKGAMPERELVHFVRTRLGSPNFRETGAATPVTNSMFLFSNAIKEGIKTDYGAATAPKTKSGYWFKTFLVDVMPKLLMIMAAYGVFGKKVKEMMDNASEYDKTNYTIVPLGLDKNGKGVYIRIPHDESGRLVSGLIWKFLNAGNRKDLRLDDLADVFAFLAGNVPSETPAFTAMGAITQFLSGKNPYDSFRGRNIISDKAFAAGWKYSLPEFANWLIQNQGGGIILPSYTPSDAEMTTLQKALNIPVLSNIIGRWIKVSDYGKTEQLREITAKVAREKAKVSIEEDKRIQQALDEYKKSDKSDAAYNKIEDKLIDYIYDQNPDLPLPDVRAKVKVAQKKLNIAVIRGKADPQVNALISAVTNDAKAELLVTILSGMDKKEADDFTGEMLDEKIISNDVLDKYDRLQEGK